MAEQVAEDMLTKIVDERDRAWQFPSERDRASRSRGPVFGAAVKVVRLLEWSGASRCRAANVAACPACGEYASVGVHSDVCWLGAWLREYDPDALPSAGQEGAKRREGKEPESPPLSGLDAATVEARVLEAALVRLRDACPEGGGCMWCYGCCAVEDCCHESSDCEFKHDVDCPATTALEALTEAARIRALATPPGQTKP